MIVRGAREDLACENDELELKCDYLYCTSAQALTLSNPNPNPNPIPIHISLNLTHRHRHPVVRRHDAQLHGQVHHLRDRRQAARRRRALERRVPICNTYTPPTIGDLYGVSSEPLGKLKNGREIMDPEDLATDAEVLKY